MWRLLAAILRFQEQKTFCRFETTINQYFLREGPLENLWGGGGGAKYQKNIRAREN